MSDRKSATGRGPAQTHCTLFPKSFGTRHQICVPFGQLVLLNVSPFVQRLVADFAVKLSLSDGSCDNLLTGPSDLDDLLSCHLNYATNKLLRNNTYTFTSRKPQ